MDRQCNIYIVEDDADVARSIEFALATSGILADVYSTGASFVAAAPDLDPGCVLLDVSMPADGLGVMRHLQNCYDRFSAIVMSGSQDEQQASLAKDLGAVAWLGKPFAEEALLEAIDLACSIVGRTSLSFDGCDVPT